MISHQSSIPSSNVNQRHFPFPSYVGGICVVVCVFPDSGDIVGVVIQASAINVSCPYEDADASGQPDSCQSRYRREDNIVENDIVDTEVPLPLGGGSVQMHQCKYTLFPRYVSPKE